jgi:hypothetical protein
MSAWDPIGSDQARELARRELDKPVYQRDAPSLLERAVGRIGDWLDELLNRVPGPNSGGSGGGWLAVVVVLVLLAAVAVLVFWMMRDRRNTRSERRSLLEEKPSTARDHRADSARHAANGDWALAIRERLRAVARDLEERAVLTPRPGRTADELAEEAAPVLPDVAEALHAGVRVFDDVWYGDRPGTREGYELLTALDELVQAAKPRPLEPGELTDSGLRSPA